MKSLDDRGDIQSLHDARRQRSVGVHMTQIHIEIVCGIAEAVRPTIARQNLFRFSLNVHTQRRFDGIDVLVDR